MKFKIHNGFEDWLIIEGDTVEEVREKAYVETNYRGWKEEDLWSEEIKDES
jgi:hypothetical protein